MYELVKVADNCYYVNCPTRVGVYDTDGGTWLIDGGTDKDAARKIWKVLSESGRSLSGIIITHSNADHIGGCKTLSERAGCRVYAPAVEAAYTEYPYLEPSLLYGGFPPKPLRNKFLMAQQGVNCEILDFDTPPLDVKIIPLPGHFLNMIGVLTHEGVFYCADAVFSREVVEKYHVNFVYDAAAAMETLERLPLSGAKVYVPAHAEPVGDISELAELNLAKMREIITLVLDICNEPLCFEDILKLLFDRLALTLDFPQYVLAGSSLRSYLSYLLDAGMVQASFIDNKLLWTAGKSVNINEK